LLPIVFIPKVSLKQMSRWTWYGCHGI